MEKTKKLFAYLIVFVAAVCILAGVTMQQTVSYAAVSPHQDQIYTEVTDAKDEDGETVGIVLRFLGGSGENKALSNEETVIKDTKGYTDEKQLALPAKTIDKIEEIIQELHNEEAKAEAVEYSLPFVADTKGRENVIVTLDTKEVADTIEFVLFRAMNSSSWQCLPLIAEEANGAANSAGQPNIKVKLPGTGYIMYGHYSQAKADRLKAQREAEANKPCCSCCSKGCPFCSFLCKDGKCYCWSMYLVIILGAIFIVLAIALLIIKIKGKKPVEVQPEFQEEAPEIEGEKEAQDKEEQTENKEE